MEFKRLFIGTFINPNVFTSHFAKIQEDFQPVASGKWVEFENIHYTYHFLSNVDTEKIPELKESLKEYIRNYEDTLIVKGLGVFPNPYRPKILFADIWNPSKSVFSIHYKMGAVIKKFGIEPEKKKYLPHIALLRVKSSGRDFKNTVEKYKNFKFGTMKNFEVSLVESTLTSSGPIYVKIV